MKTNEELQKDVQDAIKWEPLLNAAEIGVTTKDGIVTLTGVVDNYSKKLQAEEAARNVAGVTAVVEKIKIEFGKTDKKQDSEIATAVLNAFKWNLQVPNDKVKVKVEDGWVTLDGVLEWNYQREEAGATISDLIGVKGVTNNIKLRSDTHDEIEKDGIESALARNWSLNNQDIQVKVSVNKVTLTGVVSSWYQRAEAERIAFNSPGVWTVNNELEVQYNYSLVD